MHSKRCRMVTYAECSCRLGSFSIYRALALERNPCLEELCCVICGPFRPEIVDVSSGFR